MPLIYRKTAKLFESGAEVAAVLAGASPSQQRALAEILQQLEGDLFAASANLPKPIMRR